MVRAARLDVNLYEEVEADTTANWQAFAAVVIVSLATGIGTGISGVNLTKRLMASAILFNRSYLPLSTVGRGLPNAIKRISNEWRSTTQRAYPVLSDSTGGAK